MKKKTMQSDRNIKKCGTREKIKMTPQRELNKKLREDQPHRHCNWTNCWSKRRSERPTLTQ